jgi:hypothetical protein
MSQSAACRMRRSWVRRGARLAAFRGASGRLIGNSAAFLVASRGIRNQQTDEWLRGFSQMICLLVNPRAPSRRAISRKTSHSRTYTEASHFYLRGRIADRELTRNRVFDDEYRSDELVAAG